jgi:hypothetical protein
MELPGLGTPRPAIPVNVAGSPHLLSRLGANSVISGLVAGGVGGLLGFILSETLTSPDRPATTAAGVEVQGAIWVLIFGLGLGAVLMAWDGITSRSHQKALRDAASGAVVGAAAGFIAGLISQWLYTRLLRHAVSAGDVNAFKRDLLLARAVAWATFGGLLGAGLAIRGGRKKLLNGLLGGLAGGAAGGLIFQLIDNASTSTDGFGLRLIGLVATGIGIGLAIGLVERVRRDSWLVITGGPMAGKEFILYKDETTLGRDYHCDIVVPKDPSVAPVHVTFRRDHAGVTTATPSTGVVITINGAPVAGGQLRSGDIVGIGVSSLCYQEREPAVNPVGSFAPGTQHIQP